jgi:hypothetical protein
VSWFQVYSGLGRATVTAARGGTEFLFTLQRRGKWARPGAAGGPGVPQPRGVPSTSWPGAGWLAELQVASDSELAPTTSRKVLPPAGPRARLLPLPCPRMDADSESPEGAPESSLAEMPHCQHKDSTSFWKVVFKSSLARSVPNP